MNISASNDESIQSADNSNDKLAQFEKRLENAGITYSILVHEQNISSAQDGTRTGLGILSAMAPTFILRTEAGFLAAVVRGDTRLSYKKIKHALGLENVSLAAPEQVKQLTDSEIGHVALVNRGLKTIVDERVMENETIYGGSGEPNHTLRISSRSLVEITQARVFDFTELKEEVRS